MSDEEHPALDRARGLVGETIADRYRVDAVLGIGGMGAVFRCHHLNLKRDVAVKLLHPELTADQEVAPRFDREAQSASRLEHPNCIHVMDYGSWTPPESSKPIKYMVMQLLEGGELADLMGQPLPPARAIELISQVVLGLEHAHEHGIVHRDLKPENVFVTSDHEGNELLKLVDFGIAKVVSGEGSEDRLTRMGMVFGTPHYMSPEQATGMPTDARADLYSAGVMLYEMLSGRVPFDADDPVAVIRMQVSTAAPPLPESVPPEVAAIVTKAMTKERDERYESATAFRRDLEAVLGFLNSGGRRPAGGGTTQLPVDVGSAGSVARAEAPSSSSIDLGSISLLVDDAAERVGVSGRVLKLGGAAVAGGLVLFLVGVLVVRGGRSADEASAGGPSEPQGSLLSALVGGSGEGSSTKSKAPPSEDLEALDRLIVANRVAEAHAMMDGLVKAYPDDARLHWRRGKLLALEASKASVAMDAFETAIDGDPSLLTDDEFYKDLLVVLRNPEVKAEAVELALGKMGDSGHTFLLELVNREKEALSYRDRHRILATLKDDEQMARLVDSKLNLALDLWQAKESGHPCEHFAEALGRVEAQRDAYYLGTVHKVEIPAASDGDDADHCKGVSERLMALKLDLSARFPEADKTRQVPADFQGAGKSKPHKQKQQKKRRGFGIFK